MSIYFFIVYVSTKLNSEALRDHLYIGITAHTRPPEENDEEKIPKSPNKRLKMDFSPLMLLYFHSIHQNMKSEWEFLDLDMKGSKEKGEHTTKSVTLGIDTDKVHSQILLVDIDIINAVYANNSHRGLRPPKHRAKYAFSPFSATRTVLEV
ncbi:uncharacterized protein EV154DRAFT_480757 [Mucor mucedo]|uniref:uncharacterized protein n=1 Tax=Mucor mucedo TaxID=29922 RepID=UPI002220D19E|nr:uncharacterized protein EV154DRAFT_480757 [Mucor mucedo]KAI7891959.1 hypothetical protein EV154DRAFT_480757 [Mucor mucedo]